MLSFVYLAVLTHPIVAAQDLQPFPFLLLFPPTAQTALIFPFAHQVTPQAVLANVLLSLVDCVDTEKEYTYKKGFFVVNGPNS